MQVFSSGGGQMKRTISVIAIIVVIALICVLEELAVAKVSSGLNEESKTLYAQFLSNKSDINVDNVKQQYDKLDNFWEIEKHKLCYLTNYDKIRNVDESIARLKYAIENNDYSLAIDNISIIMSYGDFLHFFMGFNINNLF